MSEAWDLPPFPERGDHDENDTFAAIGRVLTQWELLEVKLAQIYGCFVNAPDDQQAIYKYGEPKIFVERLDALRIAAKAYFQGNPHQDTEAEFESLATIALNFSKRRNDVAHGVVSFFDWKSEAEGTRQFCAVPPSYWGKKFDPQMMPSYCYTSKELIALSKALFALSERVADLWWRLVLGEDGVPPLQ
jgi:hypothetical protein